MKKPFSVENEELHFLNQSFPVTGMTCAGCASSVESALKKVEGVNEASVNLATHSVQLKYNENIDLLDLKKALQKSGYDLVTNKENNEETQTVLANRRYTDLLERTKWSAALTIPVFILGMFFGNWVPGRWASLVLSSFVLFYFGRVFFVNALKQLKVGKSNMDTLVALSTGVAFFYSVSTTLFPEFWLKRGIEPHVYFEAATVIITFISLGKLLEEKAKSKTTSAIRKLMGLQPKTVNILENGEEKEVPITAVRSGDIVVVRPGERIAVDGKIVKGGSYVDESMITGEPVPVQKSYHSEVFAGTINQQGSFHFKAGHVGKDTLLAQIIKNVQEAQGSKAPVQSFVDKIAGIFTPVVLVISVLTFILWMVLGEDDAFTRGLVSSIAVLVISCPCALGLATPTAVMVGIGKGAENKILIKNAESLEKAYRVNAVVFDKTGTLTVGKPAVSSIFWRKKPDEKDYSSILMDLEAHSEHPLGKAIVEHLKKKDITPAILKSFKSFTGQGVEGSDFKGNTYRAGRLDWLKEKGITLPKELEVRLENVQSEDATLVYFANEHEVVAVVALSDEIKEHSKEAVELLYKKGIEVFLLSGDNQKTVSYVAQKVGIDQFKANCKPDDKSSFIRQLKKEGKQVAMIGDGINDAEALAVADVSIAMGKGTDIAMDVAQVTLITPDLRSVPKALELSRKTVAGIRQNLFWAFIYNIIGIPIAAGVLFPLNGFLLDPMIAGGAMALSSFSVVMNSLRLKNISL